jgi:predicted nucleic acid-binding protein
VLDASAFVRALIAPHDDNAVEWLDAAVDGRITAATPELALAEAANAFRGYVRAGLVTADVAVDKLRYVLRLPIDVVSLRLLATTALGIATLRNISAYDACYVALANGRNAVLVTADRRLAAQANRSALLPEAGPPG